MKALVVDQHPVVRAGVAVALREDPGTSVVGFAESGEGAVAEAERRKPDLVVMGMRLIGMSGVEACRLITVRDPQIKVILLTADPGPGVVSRALASNAVGVVFKRSDLDELHRAVAAVTRGATYVDPCLAARMRVAGADRSAGPFRLTPTEMRVLEYLVLGLTNSEIAERLDVSTNTIKTHLKNAMSKLRARDRTHAAAIAVREGLA